MPRGGARPGAGRPKGSLILKGVRIPQERKPVPAIHTLDAVETAEKRDRLATLSVEGRAAAFERLYEIVVGQQGTTAEQINACRALVAATMPDQPVAAVQVNVGQSNADGPRPSDVIRQRLEALEAASPQPTPNPATADNGPPDLAPEQARPMLELPPGPPMPEPKRWQAAPLSSSRPSSASRSMSGGIVQT